jgi:hypothetical protein
MIINQGQIQFMRSRSLLALVALVIVAILAFIGGQLPWFLARHKGLLCRHRWVGYFCLFFGVGLCLGGPPSAGYKVAKAGRLGIYYPGHDKCSRAYVFAAPLVDRLFSPTDSCRQSFLGLAG